MSSPVFWELLPYRLARFCFIPVWSWREKNTLHRRSRKAYIHLASGKWQRVRHISRVRRGDKWVDTWRQECIAPPPLRFGLGPIFAPLMAVVSPETYFAGTNDNHVSLLNTNYTTAHDGTTGTLGAIDASLVQVGQLYNNPNYTIWRALIPIDTSGLPDTCIPTAAALGLYGASDLTSGGDFAVTVVAFNGSNPMVAHDYDQFGSESWGSINTSSWIITGYNIINFNSTGLAAIPKTAVFLIGLRSGEDLVSSAPTGSERVGIQSADNTGTSKDPYITITYTTITNVYKVLNEALGLTDGLVSRRGMVRVLGDTLGLTDSISNVRHLVRVINENLGITELLSQVKHFWRPIFSAAVSFLGLVDPASGTWVEKPAVDSSWTEKPSEDSTWDEEPASSGDWVEKDEGVEF